MAVVDADYGTMIELCRTRMGHGQVLTGSDIKQVVALLKDAIARMDVSAEVGDMANAVDDIDTTWTAQKAILAAFDAMDPAADIVAAIATAITAMDTDMTALTAASTALDGVDPGTAPSYVTNTAADG